MGEGREGSWHQAGVGIIADLARLLAGCCAAVACSLGPAAAQEPAAEPKVPSFAELEAAGAVIGEVRIDNRNILDLTDEKENGILYSAANEIHIQTRALVGRSKELFRHGHLDWAHLIAQEERAEQANL